jgi:LuxR family transcriptional regulator, maltose regulon positive regulatory protein
LGIRNRLREDAMPQARPPLYQLVRVTERGCYQLFASDAQNPVLTVREDETWFQWLASHTSFSFQGKSGFLHLQKEQRLRGKEGYWYAYRRCGKRMVKKYVGRSVYLIPARLETIAQILEEKSNQTAASSLVGELCLPQEQERGHGWSVPSNESMRTSERHPTLLLPKLSPPHLPSSLISRERLLMQLDVSLVRKLTLLCAPAGFGKTTLACHWIKERHSHFSSVAWISLNAEDNDPVRFWRYVLTACQVFQPDFGRTALAQLSVNAPPFALPDLTSLLAMVVNEGVQLTGRYLLVLEDYHAIITPQIHETLASVLAYLPPAFHVIMITRSEPPLPLASLRAKQDLQEIRTSDLRFSAEETRCFLEEMLPGALAPQIAQLLEQRLEGWVTGLHLLTHLIRRQRNAKPIEHLLATFGGNHRYLLEYFTGEILANLPLPLQHFLLQTSLLSRLTGSLCAVVTENSESEQLLEQVLHAGLFLQSLDEIGTWYRYHQLFAEAMRAEAHRRLGKETLCACLKRASAWYEQHNLFPEAVEAALAAEDVSRAATLIEQSIGMPLSHEAHEMYTLRRWFEQLPEAIVQSSPALSFAAAMVLVFTSGNNAPALTAQVDTLLKVAQASWHNEANQTGVGKVQAFRALLAVRQGRITAAAVQARQALPQLPEEQFVWRSMCLGAMGEEERFLGHFERARQTLQEALSLCEAAENRNGARVTTLMLANVCQEKGDLHLAAALYQQVYDQAGEDRKDRARACLGQAQVAYEWNDLEHTEQAAREVLVLCEQISDEACFVQAQLLLIRTLYARGAADQAQHQCHALLAQMQSTPSLLLYREILALQARLHLSVGDVSAAQRWRTVHHIQRETLPWLQYAQEELLVAKCLLAQGKTGEALEVLKRLLDEPQTQECLRSTLEIQVVMSLAYHHCNQRQHARRLLYDTLARAFEENYRRLFLDEGKLLLALMRTLFPQIQNKPLGSYLTAILQALPSEQAGVTRLVSPGAPVLMEDLSAQERRVLRLLAAGLKRQEIAEELVLSVNTVKTHLQRLYSKLGVTNRTEACATARQLHLL